MNEETSAKETKSVVVTDIDISFSNMVGLLVKLALAAIPAALILAFIWVVAMFFFRAVMGSR